MRKAILFIAMSLDGYIADRLGGVDWLCGQNGEEGDGGAYAAFEEEIDTVVMGWRTYRQIATELSPDKWVYENLTSYVVTHREIPAIARDRIYFVQEDPCGVVEKLKRKTGKHIWICGGADLTQQLMRADAIDVYHISVMPIILGSGIRLFGPLEGEMRLKLIGSKSDNGITDLIYARR